MTSPSWLRQPVRLQPDNFTPLSRTPWAGQVIGHEYKSTILPAARGQAIGESWEFSCDPAFPSRLADQSGTLGDLVERYPDACLGNAKHCDILVKLLNPAAPLSLQVHPTDDDPSLTDGECGKPETWLVLDAEPGAGLYLGFSQALSRDDLRAKLESGADLKPFLQFVPVRAGDFFEIAPGVVHALGAGITLLEPQRVVPGLSGKTYRFWDWNRRYDRDGKQSENGEPRPLHWREALAIVDPAAQTGKAFVDSLRRNPKDRSQDSGDPAPKWLTFPANEYYQVHVAQDAQAPFSIVLDSFAALVVLKGKGRFGEVVLQGGESALLPHDCFPLSVADTANCLFAVIHPATSSLDFA